MTLSKRSVGPSRQSRTSQSSQSAADPLLSARLATQESRISASCLKQSVSSTSSASHGTNKDSDRYEQQVEDDEDRKFFDTVAGVHCITKDRLYRAKSRSLESYFNTHWNISRAQVYRYVDCAYVLEVVIQSFFVKYSGSIHEDHHITRNLIINVSYNSTWPSFTMNFPAERDSVAH
jgi:hypothetical protein